MFSWLRKSRLHTVKAFIAALNERDLDKIEAFLAADFRFIDTSNKELRGARACMGMFHRLLELAPDFRVEVEAIVERGDDILISGSSRTIIPEMQGATQWRARLPSGNLTARR